MTHSFSPKQPSPTPSLPQPSLLARLARTRFKPSLLIRFPRFEESKTPSFAPSATPLDVDDTAERLKGKNRVKVSAVQSRPQRPDALNRIVARRRGGADFVTCESWIQPEVFAEEVNAVVKRRELRLGWRTVRSGSVAGDLARFLTPTNRGKQG